MNRNRPQSGAIGRAVVTIAFAAAVFSGAGVWSLPAHGQTPMAMFWDTGVAGPGGYKAVSATNPLPVQFSASGTPQTINLTQVDGTALLVGAGATGAGSPRDTVAQDATTIAGSAPGVAGTPSANVVSVQGVSGGTPQPTTVAPTSAAAVGITKVVSAALESSHVIKAAPDNLYAIYASNLTGGVAGNLLVLNSTTVPGDGAVTPIDCVPFDSSGKAQIFYAPGPPAVFSTGIVAVISSAASCFTKTTGVLTGFISGMAP
jgi:hypothetical protein